MSGISWPQLLAGAFAGLIVAVVLVDPLKAIRNRAIARIVRAARRLRRMLSPSDPRKADLLAFGSMETTWCVLDGDGREKYENVTCGRVEPKLQLPKELTELTLIIEAEQVALSKEGKPHLWNGETLALDSYSHERTIDKERPILHLRVRPSDYYSFLATSQSLDRTLPDGKTVREKYLSEPNWTKPAESLSSSFGINVALVTKDHKLVVIRRGADVGSMPGAYGTSINEGLNVADDSPSGPDVQLCGRRGAIEELGFDLPKEDIHFLSLGVDTKLAQWGLLGIARTTATYDDVKRARSMGAKDKFEAETMDGVEFTPDAVAEFVREHPLWAPGGLACVYHALVNEHGRREVDGALRPKVARAGTRRWLDCVAIAIGLVVALSPLLLTSTGTDLIALTAYIVGGLIILIAASSLLWPQMTYLKMVQEMLAVVLFSTPWFGGFTWTPMAWLAWAVAFALALVVGIAFAGGLSRNSPA